MPAPISADRKCQHHWLIEEPNGPTVEGRCQVCSEVRMFRTALEWNSWAHETLNKKTQKGVT